MTADHLEPWNGNIVDLTMQDGTHRVGLLARIDRKSVRLSPVAAAESVPAEKIIKIADTVSVHRACRN